MGLMARTVNGYDPFEVMSAFQKCVRRGHEREAMLWALEMLHSSKAYTTMICNRIRVIAHEDIGLGDVQAVMFAVQTLDFVEYGRPPWKMAIGNVVRSLCRAAKSREGDEFLWLTLNEWVDNSGPGEVPDFALDRHTIRGKKMGRGLDHFLEEGTLLDPPAEDDVNRYHEEWDDLVRQNINPFVKFKAKYGKEEESGGGKKKKQSSSASIADGAASLFD